MAGVARLPAGCKGMVGNTVRCPIFIFQVVDMTIYAGDTLLVMGRVREVHAVLAVTGNAQLGRIRISRLLPFCSRYLF